MTVSLFSAPDQVKNGPENMAFKEIQTLTAQLSQFIGPSQASVGLF